MIKSMTGYASESFIINSAKFIDAQIKDYSFNWEPYVYPVQSHKNILSSTEAFSYLSKRASNLLLLGTSANFAYNDLQVIFKKAQELSDDISGAGHFNVSPLFYNESLVNATDKNKETNMISSSSANDQFVSSSNLAKKHIPEIIAEVGINHNGDKKQFMNLCLLAAQAKCDIVKFQYFDSASRVGNVRELEHIEKAQDMEENIRQVLQRCELSLDEIESLFGRH